MSPSPHDREPGSGRGIRYASDSEARSHNATLEQFEANNRNREELLKLKEFAHASDGVSLLEHTRKVFTELRTDGVGVELEGTRFNIIELMRLVALYHDLDKVVSEETEKRMTHAKSEAADRALKEIEVDDPTFFFNKFEKDVFRFLIGSCDYFGYNRQVLDLTGTDQQAAVDEILRIKLFDPLDKLDEEHGVYLEPEAVLRIQYEISRADTLGISTFAGNVSVIDRLFERFSEEV